MRLEDVMVKDMEVTVLLFIIFKYLFIYLGRQRERVDLKQTPH